MYTHIYLFCFNGTHRSASLKYKQWETAVVMTNKIKQLFARAENCSSNKK